jgi:hypothetical protein
LKKAPEHKNKECSHISENILKAAFDKILFHKYDIKRYKQNKTKDCKIAPQSQRK